MSKEEIMKIKKKIMKIKTAPDSWEKNNDLVVAAAIKKKEAKNMNKNSKMAFINNIQQSLNKHYNAGLVTDGKFGKNTLTALEKAKPSNPK